MLFLAGCADSRQPQVAHRQPSLRVADAALAAGAPEVALRVADLTLAREPRSSLALIAKGDALYAMGEREMARAAYHAAAVVDPTAVAAQLGLGRTLIRSDPGAAQAAFLAAIAKEPDNIAALSDLGVARDLQGHHAEAQDAYRQALLVASEIDDVKVNLGLSLALSGRKDEAIRVLLDVVANPGAAQDRRKELAGALALAGDQAEARQVLGGAYAQPQPNSRPASGLADSAPLSASHQALVNGNLAGAALGLRATSIVAMPLHEPPVITTSAAAPPIAHTQPDLLQVPPTILTAPVVAVARVSQWAPPDVARPVPLRRRSTISDSGCDSRR
jgi:Flp pilus assembly protein TadD